MPQVLCVLLFFFTQASSDNVTGLWKSDGDELLRLEREGDDLTGSLQLGPNTLPMKIRGQIAAGRFVFDYTRELSKEGETKKEVGSGFLKWGSLPTRLIGGYGPFENSHDIPDVEERTDWRYLEVDRCLSRETLTEKLTALVDEDLDRLDEIVDLTTAERIAAHEAVRGVVHEQAGGLFEEHSVGVWRIPKDVRRALREKYGDVLTHEHHSNYEADQELRNQILRRAFAVVTLTSLDMGLALDAKQHRQIHDWLTSDEMKAFRVPKKASGLLMPSGVPQERLREILSSTQWTTYTNRRTTFRKDVFTWPKREEEVLAGLQENIDQAFELRVQAWQREYTIGDTEQGRIRVLKNRVAKRLEDQRLLANRQIQYAIDLGRWSQDSGFVLIPLLDAGVLISSDEIYRRFRPGIIDKTERARYSADLRKRANMEHEAEVLRLALRIDEGGRHELSGRQLEQIVELLNNSIQPDPMRKLSHLDPNLTLSRIPAEAYVGVIGELRWENRRFWIQNTVKIAKLLNYEGSLNVGADVQSACGN